jgi:hypothetical protein
MFRKYIKNNESMVEIALIWWPPNGFDPPIVLNMDWNSAFGPKFMIKIVAMTSIWWPSNGFAQTHEIQLSPKLILKFGIIKYVLCTTTMWVSTLFLSLL